MREIKFRAWDPERNHMCQAQSLLEFACAHVTNQAAALRQWKRLIPMQFTNLYDSKKNEIWEGDVIEDHVGKRRTVVWDKRGYWKGEHPTTPMFSGALFEALADKQVSIEVIGNIYENPELLPNT